MGFITDRVVDWFGRKVLYRYGVIGSKAN
jgi:NitT/TauT family transport system permease protein